MDHLACSKIVVVTGARQVGKSTVLRRTLTLLQEAHLQISGLLTARTGSHDLTVTEVHTGATYPLTDAYVPSPTSPTPHFTMSADAFARSTQALTASFPTQVFVLDEIGPMELVHRQGWVNALDLLRRERYDQALVVVRPELLGTALEAFPGSWFPVVRVTEANRETLHAALSAKIIKACSERTVTEEER